jgi:hypothetical protein
MINKEINVLRTKIDNIKEESTQDMENLRKKNEIEMKNKMESNPAEENKQKTESHSPKMKW